MFVIENGNGGYITSINNSYTLTGNIKNAKIFDTEQKANNVIHNLPKTIRRHKFFVNAVDVKSPLTIMAHKEDESAALSHIKTILSELNDCANDVVASEKELKEKLSALDQELSDIDHYLEFYPLSAYDGYKMAKMRKERLEERRKVKDGLMEISVLRNMKAGETLGGLKNIRTQKYTPRFLNHIFEERERRQKA